MNHRVLFILSIITIAVGVGGIYLQSQSKQAEVKAEVPILKDNDTERTIVVAQALRDLQPYDILSPDDYKISSLRISLSQKDSRDISSIPNGDIRGALIKNNIASGGFITPAILVQAKDPEFPRLSLRSGELPYSVELAQRDAYLLSAVQGGDKISLFIRFAEVDKQKTSTTGLIPEGSSTARKETPKYVVMRLFNEVTVLDARRYEKAKQDKDKPTTDKTKKDEPVGVIVVRLNQIEISKLLSVAKVGEIFLMPVNQKGQQSISKMRMDEVLPQFKSVKELRGHK